MLKVQSSMRHAPRCAALSPASSFLCPSPSSPLIQRTETMNDYSSSEASSPHRKLNLLRTFFSVPFEPQSRCQFSANSPLKESFRWSLARPQLKSVLSRSRPSDVLQDFLFHSTAPACSQTVAPNAPSERGVRERSACLLLAPLPSKHPPPFPSDL